jgi:uncharacterized protein (TIRG00374 family)
MIKIFRGLEMVNLKRILSISLMIVILAFFAYYICNNIHEFKEVKIVNPWRLIFLVIITIFMAVANGLIIKYLLEPFDIKMSFKEWFGLATITTFYNTIMPFRGGLIAKAAYLKKKRGFSFTNFIAMMAGFYVINLFVAALIGGLALAFIYFEYGFYNNIISAVFIIGFVSMLIIILFSPKFREPETWILKKFIQVVNGWHIIKKNKKIILISCLVTILQIILGAIATIISFSLVGFHIEFSKAILLTSLGVFTLLIGITPGNLGITEAVQVFVGLAIGITPAISLTAAIIRRLVSMTITLVLGPIFSYLLLKHNPKSENKLENENHS